MNQSDAFDTAKKKLENKGLRLIKEDSTRPWGGFLVVDESQAQDFIHAFFPDDTPEKIDISKKLSPKLLIVGPGKRLSWQYHLRRAEIWRCIEGKVGIISSLDDDEKPMKYLNSGELIQLKQGERHRLIGLENWGIVAEIWIHTDPEHPSNEADIIRIQDDYNR